MVPGAVLPLIRHQAELRNALPLRPQTPDAEGSQQKLSLLGSRTCPKAVSLAEKKMFRRQAIAQYGATLRAESIAEAPMRGWRQLLELCRDDGIGVLLLTPPEDSTFRGMQNEAGRIAQENFFRELCGEFDVARVDCRDWLPDDDFLDHHHPLRRGAIRYSERFGREVLPRLPISHPAASTSGPPN